MSRRLTVGEEVGEIVEAGLHYDPEGLDTPLAAAAADATTPTVTEKPEDSGVQPDVAPDRGAVGRFVAELLSDPDLSYEAIVDRVKAAHPTARTTARSVASTASVMRRKGATVPLRRG